MEWQQRGTDIFVRLDPGEELLESLRRMAAKAEGGAMAIVSGVGMLSAVEMGFFDVAKDDYDVSPLAGIFDLSSLSGNIATMGETIVPHVHAVFNSPDFTTYSGHLMRAVAHITIEAFLTTSALAIERVKLPGCPATRLVGAE